MRANWLGAWLALGFFLLPLRANLTPGDARTAWAIASEYEAVLVGKIESQRIVAVFAAGEAIQIGGDSIPQGEDLPLSGVVLKSGRFKISEVIHDAPGQIKEERIWITWTEDVFLRPDSAGGSLCPPLSPSTLKGNPTIALIRYSRTGYALDHDMDPRFLDWVKQGKREEGKQQKAEEESSDPFADPDPFAE
jgi:hypothetical protein